MVFLSYFLKKFHYYDRSIAFYPQLKILPTDITDSYSQLSK